MLSQFTGVTDWLAMSLALWLAAYLLIRSHRSPTTWRAGVILGALAVAFLLAYIGQAQASFRLANAWAAALTLAIVLFYDLTYRWLPPAHQRAWRLVRWACQPPVACPPNPGAPPRWPWSMGFFCC